MRRRDFTKTIKDIEKGFRPPTLGYHITILQFCQIAETASTNIYEWGWGNYIAYVNAWKIKLNPKDFKRIELG